MRNLPVKLILYAVLTLVAVWLCFGHWDELRHRVESKVPPAATAPSVAPSAQGVVDLPEDTVNKPAPTLRLEGNAEEARESLARAHEKREQERRRRGTRPAPTSPSPAAAPSSAPRDPSPAPSR